MIIKKSKKQKNETRNILRNLMWWYGNHVLCNVHEIISIFFFSFLFLLQRSWRKRLRFDNGVLPRGKQLQFIKMLNKNKRHCLAYSNFKIIRHLLYEEQILFVWGIACTILTSFNSIWITEQTGFPLEFWVRFLLLFYWIERRFEIALKLIYFHVCIYV